MISDSQFSSRAASNGSTVKYFLSHSSFNVLKYERRAGEYSQISIAIIYQSCLQA